MTPEEYGRRELERLEFASGYHCGRCLEQSIAAVVREAVEEEREAVARLAEEREALYEVSEASPTGPGRVVSIHDFADAIRARGKTDEDE